MTFKGFPDQETFTPLPNSFFRELLDEIDDLGELQVTLYALWRIQNMEGAARFLREADFAEGLGVTDVAAALGKAVQRGSLLRVKVEAEEIYFVNTPRGRAAVESIQKGDWRPSDKISAPPPERPNVYQLYEENIGPLTPLLADALRDAESEHPAEWIEEAIAIAVKANKRNWRYIAAILKRWKEEGHAEKQDRRDSEKDRRRYVEGDYADFIEH
ncbi:MAG: DnaD domain protein [Chloroflexi bacterium]|nr:DnaD domain protein [Chloroflexota bacterium]